MSKPRIWAAFVLAMITCFSSASYALGLCYKQTVCTVNGGCYPIPTSLVPIEAVSSNDSDSAWGLPGTKCGVTDAGSGCGNKLQRSVCPDWEASCDCGYDGGPCTQFHFENVDHFDYTAPTMIEPAPESWWVATVLRDAAKDGILPATASLWHQLAAAKSVELQADASIWRSGSLSPTGKEVTGNGTFRYWEQDGRFKVEIQLPLELGLLPISVVAMNGREYQTIYADSRLLELRGFDTRRLPLPLPNPLFAAFSSFGLSDGSNCRNCEFRASDFADERHPRVLGNRNTNGKRLADGPMRYGKLRKFAIEDSGAELSIVERADGSRSRVTTIKFSERGRHGVSVPSEVRLEWYGEDGSTIVQRVDYAFKVLRFDQSIPPDTFLLSWDGLDQIFDADRNHFAHIPHIDP